MATVTISVEIVEGRGSVVASKNGTVISTINPGDGLVPLSYNTGDSFYFQAYPDTSLGYSFNKFCGDAGCTIVSTSSGFGGTVNASGYVGAYFTGTSASVNVVVQNGVGGKVDVYRNSRYYTTVTTSQNIPFFINDTYSFNATPSSGYTFSKFCSDAGCTQFTSTTNPLTGTINSSSGSVYAFFTSSSCPPLSYVSISCPSTITQGTTATFGISWSGGVAPYTVYAYRDGNAFGQSSPTNSSSGSVSVAITSSWTVGSHSIQLYVQDSCSPNKSYFSQTCTVKVVSGGGCQPPQGQRYCRDTNTICVWNSQSCSYDCNTCIYPPCQNGNCANPPSTYQCLAGVCQLSGCTAGTSGCYTENTCGGKCAATTKCTSCDTTKNYCLDDYIGFGGCQPKTYVYAAAGGFFLLMLLRR